MPDAGAASRRTHGHAASGMPIWMGGAAERPFGKLRRKVLVMKYLVMLVVAAGFVINWGVTAPVTFALPDISIALGGAYPLHLQVTLLTVATKLTNTLEENIKGEGFLVLLLVNELTALGTFDELITKYKLGTTECQSEVGSTKDPLGEILMRGTYHIVYTSLSPLTLGELSLLEPVKIRCGAKEINVKGSTLSSINTATNCTTEATECISLGGVLKGNGAGVANLTTYYNDAGAAQKAKLEANFGSGFKGAALEVEAEVTVTTLEGKMFTLTGR